MTSFPVYLRELSLVNLGLPTWGRISWIISWSSCWPSSGCCSNRCWCLSACCRCSWGNTRTQRASGGRLIIWAQCSLSLLRQALLNDRLPPQDVTQDGQHGLSHPASIHLQWLPIPETADATKRSLNEGENLTVRGENTNTVHLKVAADSWRWTVTRDWPSGWLWGTAGHWTVAWWGWPQAF